MKTRNRIISILIAAVMVISIVPFSALTAFATEPEITEVSTFGELLNAVNSDKTYIKLTANIKDIVPDDELPTKHRLVFDGGKEYVLDLNGYSLDVVNHINEYYVSNFPMISVSGNSSLEIKDGSLGFDNWYAGNNRKARGVVHVEDTSTLAATHVNMRNWYTGNIVSATADAHVTLDGGEYTVQNGFAIYLDRQASLTLDGDVYIHTVVGDSANTQYVDGYGALYSESTGELVIHNAFFKSGIQVHSSQIGAFSIATHELTINGKVMTEDIFVGNSTEAKNQNKEYFWYSYNQNALENVQNNSFVNTVRVISYDKKYHLEVMNGTATIDGTPVTEVSYGQTVTIVANTPEEGMEFLRWDTSGVNLADYYNATTTFTMPPAPVTLAAYYGKESVKSVSLTVDTPTVGQKVSEINVSAENATIKIVEWYENYVLMNENDVFKPGKSYKIKTLLYPPEEHKFDDNVTTTVNGDGATIEACAQYAYVSYEVVTLAENPFPVVYNSATAQLGIGGRLELDTDLMASQSAIFKEAYDAGTVEYQWYKNGEIVEWAITPAYYFEAEDVGSAFYVIVTAGDKTAWGDTHDVYNYLYQVYLNAGEYVAGGKAPQMSSATPGVGIIQSTLWISEGYGQPALDIEKAVLIPGKSYVLSGQLVQTGEALVPYGANVYVNGEMMPKEIDGIGRFYYEFEVPEADYPVYYKANGEIGIGVTLTVDVEKMCQESSTFKHAYEAANPTYQTVFYQWCRNGEKIKGATKETYTVSTADKDSMINCVVTLVDGKCGVGEQFSISNIITVLNVNIPYPKDGEARLKTGISADGAVLSNIMWVHQSSGKTMSGDDVDNPNTDKYVEGEVYEYVIVFEVKDGFNFDYQGATTADMTLVYIYGEKLENAGTGAGLMYYYGEVTAIHKHQYSDSVWDSDADVHWQPCIIPGCPAPNEEWQMCVPHWGGNATCCTPGTCAQCGAEYYAEHDVSVPDYVYIDDMKCGTFCATEGCDYLSSWSYHEGGTSDCQHKAICEICHHEYGNIGDHVPKAEWQNDEDSHWHECSLCAGQQLEKSAHEDSDENGICDVCGKTLSVTPPPSHTHDFGTTWKNDANNHWKECECGEKSENAAHIDDNGDNKCDTCNYAMPAHDPDNPDNPNNTPDNPNNTPDDPSDDKDGLGAGAIVGIVVGSVAVVGIGGFALFWFVIKKKSFADLIAVFKK